MAVLYHIPGDTLEPCRLRALGTCPYLTFQKVERGSKGNRSEQTGECKRGKRANTAATCMEPMGANESPQLSRSEQHFKEVLRRTGSEVAHRGSESWQRLFVNWLNQGAPRQLRSRSMTAWKGARTRRLGRGYYSISSLPTQMKTQKAN